MKAQADYPSDILLSMKVEILDLVGLSKCNWRTFHQNGNHYSSSTSIISECITLLQRCIKLNLNNVSISRLITTFHQ
jgi:hypothetical protein